MNARPLIARLQRKFGGKTIFAAANERVELAPRMLIDRRPAIALAGEFDRASEFYETREMERSRVVGGARSDGGTTAYLLRNGLIAHGAVYKNMIGDFYRADGPRFLLSGRPERRSEALLATSRMSEVYFGDWLLDSFCLAQIAERRGVAAVRFARPSWLHQSGYEALFGLAPEPIEHARFDKLWLVDDRGLNADRAARLTELRRRLRMRVGEPAGSTKIFLSRGTSGKPRDVLDLPALEQFLVERDFVIVHPERQTAAELAGMLATARVVMTVEGSAQAHALMAMPTGGTLVILQPPLRFTAPGKEQAEMAGIDYAYLVGNPAGDNFAIDLDRLGLLLDQVESKAG